MPIANGFCSVKMLDESLYGHFQPKYAEQSISSMQHMPLEDLLLDLHNSKSWKESKVPLEK